LEENMEEDIRMVVEKLEADKLVRRWLISW
jgi:hypothetical protein